MATLRRAKWQQPPPPPRILHLARRPRRKQPEQSGKLETLFCHATPPVVLLNSGRDRSEVGVSEEKWRFQAEILRAECKFLRMERQIAVRRLDRERVFVETTLKSALHSLISARRKLGEGRNVMSLVLEEEIEELAKKVAELQKSSKKTIRRDPDLLKETRPSSSDFEKESTLVQKQLYGDQECVIEVPEVVKASRTKTRLTEEESGGLNKGSGRFIDVEILTRKMEGLSEGRLLKKMEDEYGSILCRTANTSAASSQRYDLPDLSSSLQIQLQEKNQSEQKICAGHCKVIVRRIMEQVRAETEQWSQMQEMVGQVREEMERLQASRDFWEGRALDSDNKIQSLNATVQEWKQKAHSLEIKEKQLGDVVKSVQERTNEVAKDLAPVSREVIVQPHEKEKRVLTCRVKGSIQAGESFRKETHILHEGHKGFKILASPNRQPFHDIGNFSPLTTHNSKRWVLPSQTP